MVLSQRSPLGTKGNLQTQNVTHYFEMKKKKLKEESIGPNQCIHLILVMEYLFNSSLNRIDLQSSCFFLFISLAISFSPFTSANAFAF